MPQFILIFHVSMKSTFVHWFAWVGYAYFCVGFCIFCGAYFYGCLVKIKTPENILPYLNGSVDPQILLYIDSCNWWTITVTFAEFLWKPQIFTFFFIQHLFRKKKVLNAWIIWKLCDFVKKKKKKKISIFSDILYLKWIIHIFVRQDNSSKVQ